MPETVTNNPTTSTNAAPVTPSTVVPEPVIEETIATSK